MTKHIFDIENALMAEKQIFNSENGLRYRTSIRNYFICQFWECWSLVFQVFYGMWDWLETAQSNIINCWSLLSNLSDEEEFWDESSAN